MFKRTLVSLFLVFTILLTLGVSAASGAPPAAEVLAQEEMTYTVKLGDNLWALAEKYLDSGPAYWAPPTPNMRRIPASPTLRTPA